MRESTRSEVHLAPPVLVISAGGKKRGGAHCGCRCIVQLSILGYILVPIFTLNTWEVVLVYASVMAFIGAYEAISRPAYGFKVHVLDLALSRSASLTL